MTPDTPLLIVTLPGRTVEAVRAEVEIARAGGADVAEVRLDRWSTTERSRAAELFPSPLPLMATLRSRAEGGEGPDAPEERIATLEEATRLPFRWVDLEEARDGPMVASFPAGADAVRVLSTHLPQVRLRRTWSGGSENGPLRGRSGSWYSPRRSASSCRRSCRPCERREWLREWS